MSGKIVGWVHDTNLPRGQKAVLAVLAGYLPNPGDGDPVCWPKVETVAARASMTERHTRRLLAELDRDGWIAREVNRGREHTNRYTVDLDKLREAAKTGHLGRKQNRTLVTENRTLEAENRTLVTADLSENRQESSVSGPPPEETGHLPGVLAGMTDVTEDEREAVRVVIHHARHVHLEPQAHVVRVIVAALRAGHTLADIRAYLDPPRIDWTKVDAGAVVMRLRELADNPIDQTRSNHPRNGKRLEDQGPPAVVHELAAVFTDEDEEARRARHEALMAETRQRVRAASRAVR